MSDNASSATLPQKLLLPQLFNYDSCKKHLNCLSETWMVHLLTLLGSLIFFVPLLVASLACNRWITFNCKTKLVNKTYVAVCCCTWSKCVQFKLYSYLCWKFWTFYCSMQEDNSQVQKNKLHYLLQKSFCASQGVDFHELMDAKNDFLPQRTNAVWGFVEF